MRSVLFPNRFWLETTARERKQRFERTVRSAFLIQLPSEFLIIEQTARHTGKPLVQQPVRHLEEFANKRRRDKAQNRATIQTNLSDID